MMEVKLVPAEKELRQEAALYDFVIEIIQFILLVIAIINFKQYYPISFIIILLFVIFNFIQIVLTLRGTSLGKKIMGIRVVNLAGCRPKLKTILYRQYIKNKNFFIILFDGKMIHDDLTYTQVIHVKSSIGFKLKPQKDYEIIEDEWTLN